MSHGGGRSDVAIDFAHSARLRRSELAIVFAYSARLCRSDVGKGCAFSEGVENVFGLCPQCQSTRNAMKLREH